MLDIDIFGRNEFLNKLYPKGIENIIMIKDFVVSVNGTSEFSFFISQQPDIEIKKWGKWGEDFNCLWIKTSNSIHFSEIYIKNLHKMGFAKLSITKDSKTKISSKKDKSEFVIVLEQGCRFIIQEIIPITIDD